MISTFDVSPHPDAVRRAYRIGNIGTILDRPYTPFLLTMQP